MSILNLSLPDILSPEKFQLVANKGVGTHRVIYQRVDTCPNGTEGCRICTYPGSRPGRHPRPLEQIDVVLERQVRGAWGKPNALPHRWRLGQVTLVAKDQDYVEGEGFHIEGRQLIWHLDAPVADQERFGLRYRAYREDWINVQHADVRFAGGPRQTEEAKNLAWAQVDQGVIAISVLADTAGYYFTQDDRFIPLDAEMDFDTQIDVQKQDTHSRHLFVTEITRAFGLNHAQTQEVEVLGITFDQQRMRFILPEGPLPPVITINYRAVPIYGVYLDQGEFRYQGTRHHARVALLQREEINR